MLEQNQGLLPQTQDRALPERRKPAALPPKLLYVSAALAIAFCIPLYRLFQFALGSDLYSYILLVPAVSIYLFVTHRPPAAPAARPGNRSIAIALAAAGAASLVAYALASQATTPLPLQDAVAVTTLSFVLLIAAACAWFLDAPTLRAATFPLAFLLFMVPFPLAMEHGIESFLQRGSAPPAFWFLRLAGTPVFREDLIFQLPGITLHIAPECSGIRSSIVLFMTSLVAGYLFLRSNWKRAILTLAVIPLALLRNGFRVFVIGQLCVSVGPHMIDSPIHHHGGPIFFGLSLIPFSIFTYYLVKSDRRNKRSKTQRAS